MLVYQRVQHIYNSFQKKTQTPFCEAKLISTSQTFSFRPSKSFRTDMFTASVNLPVEPVAGNHHESPWNKNGEVSI